MLYDDVTLDDMLRMMEEQNKPPTKRVVKLKDVRWQLTEQGRIGPLVGPWSGVDSRIVANFYEEIPPGGHSGKHSHTFEAIIYCVSGKGYDIHDGVRYDWEEGDAIYIPPHVAHQHFNASTDKPARVLGLVPIPLLHHMRVNRIDQLEPGTEWIETQEAQKKAAGKK